MNEQTTKATRVVVIGGGYAGVLAANRLSQRSDIDIALVNPRPRFVERIRLHQLAAGNDDATEAYDALLADSVALVVDEAIRIDPAVRQVHLASGTELNYDYLIYAVGSTGAIPAGVPGAAEFAYPLAELEQAERLQSRLADVPMSAPIVVVGGGLTGIEAASEFAEQGRQVTLVGDALAPSLADSGRKSVAKALAKLGVTVLTGRHARVTRVLADGVEVADGRVLPSAATVWTAGFGVPGLAAASGLRTDQLGRLLTDETLTSVDDPRVIAAGDAGSPSGLPLRMSCQSAMPLAAQAADTVLARIAGGQPKPIGQAFAGQCISLGRHAGTVQLVHADDSPRRVFVGGRTGAFIKEQVCKFTLTALRREVAKPGVYRVFKSDWRDELLAEPAPQVPVK